MTPTFLIIVITAHSNHSVVYSNFVISHLSRSLLLRCYDYVISDKRIFSGSPNLKYFCTSLRVEVFILFSTCCPKAGKSIKEYEYEIIAQCNKQIVRFHIFNSLSLFYRSRCNAITKTNRHDWKEREASNDKLGCYPSRSRWPNPTLYKL